MSRTTPPGTRTRPARPGAQQVRPSGSVTRVAHQGGPRHGAVTEIASAALAGYLVYDGPRWVGVYEQADPPRTVQTLEGPAELWVAIDA